MSPFHTAWEAYTAKQAFGDIPIGQLVYKYVYLIDVYISGADDHLQSLDTVWWSCSSGRTYQRIVLQGSQRLFATAGTQNLIGGHPLTR